MPTRTVPQRIITYFRVYPLRAAGTVGALAAALALTVILLRPVKDTNPAYAKIKNEALSVYNTNHEVLWTKNAKGMPDDSSYVIVREDEMYKGTPYAFGVIDIDGDGTKEVLIAGPNPSKMDRQFSNDTVYCFNANGTLRWKQGMGSGIKFGTIDFSKRTSWQIRRFLPVRRSAKEKMQLFVIGYVAQLWPSKLAELDPLTGNELQSYWHAGNLGVVLTSDIEGDGRRELVLAGVNNLLNAACVIVFDPANLHGVGPTTPEFFPKELSKGTEKYYLLLPRTSYGKALAHPPYNGVSILTTSEQNVISLLTIEALGSDWQGGIVYSFDEKMKITYALGNDLFVTNFPKAREQGLLHEELNSTYYENLKNSLLYWDGEKFVKEAVMNRIYLGKFKP